MARAAAKALGASVALIDRSSAVLAVAASSSAEEGKLLSEAEDVESAELRVADAVVGELRYRARGEPPSPALTRMVSTLLALEVERSRAPEWASDEAAGAFVRAVIAREVTDRGDIVARAAELGAEIEAGAGVVIARAAPRTAQSGDWRARVLTVALRALRSTGAGSLGALAEGEPAEVAAIVPASEDGDLARAAQGSGARARRLAARLRRDRGSEPPHPGPGRPLPGRARRRCWPPTWPRPRGSRMLAFEDTGAYRLLLPAMSEDPGELERFYEETLAPLAAYDEQYETELVASVEAYLENDGNVAQTAAQLFTHRHTVRYRLERVRELSGHDISSSEGREKLEPRAEGDARAGDRRAARPGDRARHRGGQGPPPGGGLAGRLASERRAPGPRSPA